MSAPDPGEVERAAEITGCRRWGYGAYCEHRRDDVGQVPWDQCRWVPVAAALAAARVDGAAQALGEIVRWARFRCGSLTVDALHRECLARAADIRAALSGAHTE